jgi:hypothetical protein
MLSSGRISPPHFGSSAVPEPQIRIDVLGKDRVAVSCWSATETNRVEKYLRDSGLDTAPETGRFVVYAEWREVLAHLATMDD